MTDKKDRPVASCVPIYDTHEKTLKFLMPREEEQTDFEKIILALYRLGKYGTETEFQEPLLAMAYNSLHEFIIKTRETTLDNDQGKQNRERNDKINGISGAIIKSLKKLDFKEQEIDRHTRDIKLLAEKVFEEELIFKELTRQIHFHLGQGKNLANTFNCIFNREETEQTDFETVDTETGEIISIPKELGEQVAKLADTISDKFVLPEQPTFEELKAWINTYGYKEMIIAVSDVEEEKNQGKEIKKSFFPHRAKLNKQDLEKDDLSDFNINS